ncbi:hypothetical protein CEXT_501951 [Caerostris extrusa]|uniref:Uncharacterized protein n=1 Tax=Caerostris extrusa TaxID=172846 RepID=A0AAV4YFN8_CAEEX|nr:hypothetical protein CEXT_501951 [Caerostris extrusa]
MQSFLLTGGSWSILPTFDYHKQVCFSISIWRIILIKIFCYTNLQHGGIKNSALRAITQVRWRRLCDCKIIPSIRSNFVGSDDACR